MTAAAMPAPSFLTSVAWVAPGLLDWPAARTVLRGESVWTAAELPTFQPERLPPNERRRASATVRMAFRVADEALRDAGVAADELATVFASADGDLAIAARICTALAQPPRQVSPTDFHNSVHNAPAGYWSIAVGATGPSTAVAAGDGSFAAGLLEAHLMAVAERRPTLLVAYDVPAPAPLQAKRPLRHAVGTALLLLPQDGPRTLASLRCTPLASAETVLDDAALEALRTDNPAARALPLLQRLACGHSDAIDLPLTPDLSLRVQLQCGSPP